MTLILLALGGLAVILLWLGEELWRIAEVLEAMEARAQDDDSERAKILRNEVLGGE